jgi:hypothetical protein
MTRTAKEPLNNSARNPYGTGLCEVSASFGRAHLGKNIQSWPNHTCPSQAGASRKVAVAPVLSYSEVP